MATKNSLIFSGGFVGGIIGSFRWQSTAAARRVAEDDGKLCGLVILR